MRYLILIFILFVIGCSDPADVELSKEGDSCIDNPCERGLICKNDICIIDNSEDKCKDVKCELGETCNTSTGVCEKKESDKCKDVKCEPSEICNENSGKCEEFKSSEEMHMAISTGENEKEYEIKNYPLLYKGKLYTQLFRDVKVDKERALKIVSYDLSKLIKDTTLESLIYKTIYEQVGPNFSTSHFNTRLYSVEEVDGMLYYQTLPKKEAKGQNCFTKYDLENEIEVYHVKKTPAQGKDLNTTFDLARGYFVPFNNNQYIAIAEEALIRVINPIDGSSYKYGTYDYLSNGMSGGNYTTGVAYPSNEDSIFVADSNKFVASAFLASEGYVEYGSRDMRDPQYKEKDIFVDFMGKYTGDKKYTKLSSTGDSIGTFSMVIDGDSIYFLVGLVYEKDQSDNGLYDNKDIYLLKYNTDANLEEITYIDTDKNIMFSEATNLYKYDDTIFFRYQKLNEELLYAYDLKEKKIKFTRSLGTSALYSARLVDSYVITGDKIIIPEIYYEDESSFYDIVINIIDINDGKVLKTLKHKNLRKLSRNYKATIKYSFSDKNSVYFVGEIKKDKLIKNFIIKIDSKNQIEKSRYRFDNHHTGIAK